MPGTLCLNNNGQIQHINIQNNVTLAGSLTIGHANIMGPITFNNTTNQLHTAANVFHNGDNLLPAGGDVQVTFFDNHCPIHQVAVAGAVDHHAE